MKPSSSLRRSSLPAKNTACGNSCATSRHSWRSSDDVGSDTDAQLGMEAQVGGEAAVFDQVVGHLLFELLDLFRTLHQRRIDFAHADEDHVAELVAEQPRKVSRVARPRPLKPLTSSTAVGALGSYFSGGLSLAAKISGRMSASSCSIASLMYLIMVAHHVAQRDQRAGYHDRHPAALVELQRDREHQDERRERAADAVDRELALPVRLARALLPPMHAHPELRERERDEHVDRVEHDQQIDSRVGEHQDRDRRQAHREHSVLGHQARAEVGEAARQPAIDRHRRQHARPVDEAGLRGNEQQRAFGDQGEGDDRHSDRQAEQFQLLATRSNSTALSVWPCTGATLNSR